VELQQLSGDEAVRTLVRRAEGGWCGDGGTACDLADEVLGQYPLAVSISTACQWRRVCDTCDKKTHSAQCKGTVCSYQYVQPPSASEGEPPPAPTSGGETLQEAPAASGGSDAARLVAELAAVDEPDCIWLNPPPPPLRWSCPAGWECEAHDQDAAFAAHRDACGRGYALEELEIICPLATEEPVGATMEQLMADLGSIVEHASGHTVEHVIEQLGVEPMQVDTGAETPTVAPTAAPAPPLTPPAGAAASLWRCLCGWTGDCASAEAAAAAHSAAAARERCRFAPLKGLAATYYHCSGCDWSGETRARHGRSKGCTDPAVRSFSYPKHMVVVSCASCVASEGGGACEPWWPTASPRGACEPWCEAGWQALAAHAKRSCTRTPNAAARARRQ